MTDEPRYDTNPIIVYGFYDPGGFEVSARLSGGIADDRVCVRGSPDILPNLREGAPPRFAVVEGNLSQRGRFGHLGGECTRELLVTRVVEMRDLTPTELNSLNLIRSERLRLDDLGARQSHLLN
jgi:hypothetical protein